MSLAYATEKEKATAHQARAWKARPQPPRLVCVLEGWPAKIARTQSAVLAAPLCASRPHTALNVCVYSDNVGAGFDMVAECQQAVSNAPVVGLLVYSSHVVAPCDFPGARRVWFCRVA